MTSGEFPSTMIGVHFEFVTLEGAQAGLSWETILRKREHYRELFHDFDPAKVARMTSGARRKDPHRSRHRAQPCKSRIDGQQREGFPEIQKEFGSFDKYVWHFVGGKTLNNRIKRREDLPAESEESRALSKDLVKRGFRFVGPTIMYAFMQATGLVNDHIVGCFRNMLAASG